MQTRRTLHRDGLLAAGIFLGAWLIYALTCAPGTIYGDPSEYQFIPAIWGIAHPPGYAFYTLLAGIWQRLFIVGSVAYRTNLLAGAAGAWTVSRIALIVLELGRAESLPWPKAAIAATSAAAWLAIAPDVWQQSIHANAHIVSAAITSTQLWLLVRWTRDDRPGWLYALAFFCGLGVTHHPITIWGLPSYAVFIAWRLWKSKPRLTVAQLLRRGGLFSLSGLLGLTPWLYFPLRSPSAPFGPRDMRTWAGFWRHATAQGLRVNLFHFGLADAPDRLHVFWSLLRLQYPWPVLLLLAAGIVVLVRRHPDIALLWGLFLIGHLGFTLNSVQDVMAYLLHPFAALAIPVGAAVLALAEHSTNRQYQAALLGLGGLWIGALFHTAPRISLRDWDEPDRFVTRLVERFAGRNEHAAFVSDWEHLTPYFYATYVEGLPVDPADLRPVYVTGASPWPESVFANLPQGPVYLSNYRRDIRTLGFRLRPVDGLWQVLEPPATQPVTPQTPLADVWADERVAVLGYDLPQTTVAQGGVIPLVLYTRVATTQTDILMPYARLGQIEQRWTTDSRRLTPDWRPGEIIAEQYTVYVPYTLPPGDYPLALGYADMSDGRDALPFSDGETRLPLGVITVQANPAAVREGNILAHSLTNLGNDVALRSAHAQAGFSRRRGLWSQPLSVPAGQSFHLTLTWRALRSPRTSYTVFIHLIDAAGQPVMGHDYTPLGGAFPSYLWFPKWLAGQQVDDPYRLTIPPETPPGTYQLEVGLYEMGSVRRIPQFNLAGTLTGDRLILGPVNVTARR